MNKKWFVCIITGVVLSLTLSATAPAQNCKIDGFNSVRAGNGWSFTDGTFLAPLRALLTSTTYFDATAGAVPFGITILAGQTTVTGASLTFPASTVFATGWIPTSSYTGAEKTAILAYVMAGGNFLGTFDDTGHTASDIFGVTTIDFGGSANLTIKDRNHSIMDGPFGGVETLINAGAYSQFSVLPGSTAQILAANQTGTNPFEATVLVFDNNALGPGSGRVVLINDTNFGSVSDGGGDDNVMILNTFAFLCGAPGTRGGNTFYFPQTAQNQGFSTRMIATSAFNSSSVPVSINFFSNTGVATGNCGTTTVGGSSTFAGCNLGNSQTSPIVTGWARTRSSDRNNYFATESFLLSDPSGNPQSVVGVPAASPGHNFTLTGIIGPNNDLGVAILALPTNSAVANITVKAFDGTGTQIGATGNLTLNPGNQTAAFASQAPFNVPRATFQGISVTISSDQQIGVLALGDAEPGARLFGTPTFGGRK
ncbi:MAG: hypothetical protein PHX83_07915 [Acidobacteriia bacterium]|nr:hypothetical protein [Terriglobia bacterium]